MAHRISYEISAGKEIPPGVIIMHSCDNPQCVNPAHLSTGTSMDNCRDCIAKGRNAKGERNGRARLTEEQVSEIRGLYNKAAGRTLHYLAKAYHVGHVTIWNIVRQISWRPE